MARAPAAQDAEVLPEADRLDDFPHPRETPALYGHEDAERMLAEAFAAGRMHHAWLVTGSPGIGKATLAYRLARHVLARPEERDPAGRSLHVAAETRAARQVTALSHPGLLLLRRPYDTRAKRFAQTIPVDEVRRLKSFLGLTAGDEAWRMVLVDSGDELNINAANALLKSLEEPPKRTLFVLLSAAPSLLLPTIRSRCRRLDLAPLAGAPLRKAVESALAAAEMDVPDAEAWDRLEALAQGSVRRALQLTASGGIELYARIEAIFSSLPGLDWQAAHALAEQMGYGAPEQRYRTFYELFTDLLQRLVRSAATGEGTAAETALAARLIPQHRLPAWAAFWQKALADKADADELNLDRKALITGLFAQLEELVRDPKPPLPVVWAADSC